MSIYLNKVILAGNLTKDPVMGETKDGTPAVEFSIAINRKFTDKNGQKKQETCYVDCSCYGPKSHSINEHFFKGRGIMIDGSLRFQSYKDKQGQTRNKLKVFVEEWQFVDYKKNGETDNVKEEGGFEFDDSELTTVAFDSLE